MPERNFEAVTTELGKAHVAKSRFDTLRKEFFELTEKEAASGTLAQKTVSVDSFADESEARDWLSKHYPAWEIVGFELRNPESLDDDEFVALLRENPRYVEHTFINEADGKVYKKTVKGGSPLLDDDRLKNEKPDLWERITYLPEPQRMLRSSEEIDPDDLEAMQEYMYPAPPTLVLPAPRKAKKEDLESQ